MISLAVYASQGAMFALSERTNPCFVTGTGIALQIIMTMAEARILGAASAFFAGVPLRSTACLSSNVPTGLSRTPEG